MVAGLSVHRPGWHAACTSAAQEVLTMDVTTIVNAAAIPPELIGTLFEPAALFGVWSALVVVVLAGLVAVLGMESPAPARTSSRLRILARCGADEQRAAA